MEPASFFQVAPRPVRSPLRLDQLTVEALKTWRSRRECWPPVTTLTVDPAAKVRLPAPSIWPPDHVNLPPVEMLPAPPSTPPGVRRKSDWDPRVPVPETASDPVVTCTMAAPLGGSNNRPETVEGTLTVTV